MPSEESTPVLLKPARRGIAAGQTQGSPLRVGIVGCGALVAHGYLPAFSHSQPATPHCLVDRDIDRAQALARQWGVPKVASDAAALEEEVDAAIVAVPNHLHEPIASDLLRRGVPVLVEKPMGRTVAECETMIAAASEGGASLAVGFVCRYSRAARWTKKLLQSGMLGPVRSFQAENGAVFGWPLVSDYLFRREKAGGGVLIDIGSHVLDLLTWWLGAVKDVEHYDDNFGGVEADSLTRLEMENGARGTVRLSRTCQLRQQILIECERASLCVHLDRPAVKLRLREASLQLDGEVAKVSEGAGTPESFVDLLSAQLCDWAGALREGRRPSADGEAGREVSRLIERCYASRRDWILPWVNSS